MIVVAPMEIRVFSDLVNKARVVEEYAKTVASSKVTHGGNTSRGRDKHFQLRGQNFKRGGHAPQGQGGFKKNPYNQFQSAKGRGNQSKISPDLTCVHCGSFHPHNSCKIGLGGCFNCGLPSHIARDCTHGRNPNAGQIALYDTGASHSLISFDKVEELGLKVSELAFELHVHTSHQTVMTKSGCRQFMSKGENRAVIAEGYFLNSVIVHCSGEECQGYILLTANALGDALNLDQILIVRDFPKVFPEDIPEFPPQREIEFTIELVPGAGLVSIAPYRMALIELAELKNQLEKLLNKRFI
ncbi:uncharacterized protein LOC107607509 [Arachis ipaensis]|uniref:uncharacterized protein LOC107607509 n=1 Tax=Arachis ipaensis TaxID=130454 RepID=UPI0007AF9F12|nr:uncharacterized protein LOC107607509 [Arachis ipaensis]